MPCRPTVQRSALPSRRSAAGRATRHPARSRSRGLGLLRQRLDNPSRRAEDVAGVLAEAVRLRSDAKLRRALQPLLEEALQLSVQSNPRMLADALFPIFGKAIRKAITSELDGMLQSLSQTLEQSFSLAQPAVALGVVPDRQAVRRDCHSAQPAVPRGAGVSDSSQDRACCCSMSPRRTAETKDPEMVSGMLDRDPGLRARFGQRGGKREPGNRPHGRDRRGAGLRPGRDPGRFRARRRAPQAELACFKTRSTPSSSKKAESFAYVLRRYFASSIAAGRRLQACLLGQGKPDEREPLRWAARALLFGLPAAVAGALAGWWIYSAAMERRWTDFAHRLEQRTRHRAHSHRKARLEILHLRPARSLGGRSRIALAAELVPPTRPSSVGKNIIRSFLVLPPSGDWQELKDELEKRAFRFMTGSAEVPARTAFPSGRRGLPNDRAHHRRQRPWARRIQIEVRGNHDPVGTEQFNAALARSRAENVQAALVSLGVPAARLTAVPEDLDKETCSAVKEEERLFCRSASFRVIGIPLARIAAEC